MFHCLKKKKKKKDSQTNNLMTHLRKGKKGNELNSKQTKKDIKYWSRDK